MENKTLSLETQLAEQPLGGFHFFRLRFNSQFLKEDFIAAKSLCLQEMKSDALQSSERLELARCFMLLGESEDALHCLDSVLEIEPENLDALNAKLRLLKSIDKISDYYSLLQQSLVLHPREQGLYELLASYYADQGDEEGIQRIKNDAELNGCSLPDPNPIPDPVPDQEQNPVYNDPLMLETYLSLFAGRENFHARQWISDKGKTGYTPVSDPLTHPHIRSHLLGLYTIGAYQLNLSNQVKWIMFDLDVSKEYLNDLNDPQFKDWLENGFYEVLGRIHQLLSSFHLSPLYEFSGFKGYHIWLLFNQFISASLARGVAQKLATQFDLGSYPFTLEIFPKQTRISPTNLGNLVKLPGGIHRISGLRSFFLKFIDGKPVTIALQEVLKNPPLIQDQQFMDLIQALQPDFSETLSPFASGKSDSVPLTDIAETDSSDPLSNPRWLWLKQHCSVLSQLCNELDTHRILSNNQKKVITYSAGLLEQGHLIVNALLRKCSNLQPTDLLKSPLKGNPVSCTKIRSYVNPETGSELCTCDFSALNPSYDNPLLHLSSFCPESAQDNRNHELILRDTVTRYLDIRKKHRELEAQLRELETTIFKLFDEIGVQEFHTGYGLLKKVSDNDKLRLILEF